MRRSLLSMGVGLAAAATTLPAQPTAGASPAVSGVMYLTYRTGGTEAERRHGRPNRFDVDRAYLTVRAPAGDRMTVRLTADVYQQRDPDRSDYYAGWTLRMKYAYAQYDFLDRAGGFRAGGRLGMLQTPIIEHEESFWLRGVASAALEQQGYFQSADVGAAALVNLPGQRGEIYATVLNGSGYASRETDRFKDVGGRVTLTPFATRPSSILQSLAVTPWVYKGWRDSDFARGRGTVGAVKDGRRKDRLGLHVGVRDPRVTVAAQLAWRIDELETADTLRATAPTVTDRVGRLISAYIIARPVALVRNAQSSRYLALVRVDHVRPDAGSTASSIQTIGGIGYQLNARAQVWIDHHSVDASRSSSITESRTAFVRAIINF